MLGANWELGGGDQIRVRIDPNVHVHGNATLVGFEDFEGFDPVDLHVGEVVTVYEPEAGLRGEGAIVEVDPAKQLVIVAVDWSSLLPEEAWADWDAQVAAMMAGAGERLRQPARADDLDELRARLVRWRAAREA